MILIIRLTIIKLSIIRLTIRCLFKFLWYQPPVVWITRRTRQKISPPSEETVDEDVALVASLTGLRANHNLRERERERVRERERRRRPVRPGSSCWCPHTSHQPCHSTSKFFTSNFVNKTKKLHLQLLITQSVCAAGGHTVT